METNRQKKIGGVIQKDLVDILQGEVRKNGLANLIISVSKVTVTTDLSVATVHLSVFPQDKAKEILDRLKNKIEDIQINDGFVHFDYIFKRDGNVYKTKKNESKLICNLFTAKKNNQIEWGVKWGNLKSSSTNPHQFRVLNGNIELRFLFGLIETGVHLKITPYTNIDVFNYILSYFIENEEFPKIPTT